MIELDLDLTGLQIFSAQWGGAHRRALSRALKAEAYRLADATKETLRAGVGSAKAPLTRAIAKRRGARALAAFAPLTRYEVSGGEGAEHWEARVGLTAKGRRKRPVPVQWARSVTGGDRHTVTRGTQLELVRKFKRRGRQIGAGMLPRVGAVLEFPQRDWPRQVADEQGRRIPDNVLRLYQMQMRGERWKSGKWWIPYPEDD